MTVRILSFVVTVAHDYAPAPSPKGAPSQNLVLALWKTAALPKHITSHISLVTADTERITKNIP